MRWFALLQVYFFTGREDIFRYAARRPQQFPPNTVGRYRNCDPVLVNYLTRLGVEGTLKQEYLPFPQRQLFDRIGVRSAVLETDAHGNFLAQVRVPQCLATCSPVHRFDALELLNCCLDRCFACVWPLAGL